MGASQRAATTGKEGREEGRKEGRSEGERQRILASPTSRIQMKLAGKSEQRCSVAARWLISDSLYPFENENAALHQLTAAERSLGVLRVRSSVCAIWSEYHET